jgi:hypothetical protein
MIMNSNIVEMKAQSRALSNGILNPENLHEAMEMATVLSKSSLIPKDFQGNPGNVLIAIQWGMELGLAPMQAIQSIAVINGRPSLWGDAVIALCKSHPICEWVKETFDEDGTAVCVTQRKGDPEPVERRFSLADAVKAGLSGKAGPWTQYPKRMLQMRARSWCLRDAYPDLLRGMAVADEEQDRVVISEAPPVPALPEGASKTEKVKAKLAALNAPTVTVATLDGGVRVDTATGEVLPEEDPVADLLLAISECRSREELEVDRAAVAVLRNGQKKRAVEAWKAIETRLADQHGE